jgi:dihydropteroate synthase
MGIINMTEDSFSDGGEFNSVHQAIDRSLALIDAGADVVDIGAESTRPGSNPVDPGLEWKKLKPVLCELDRLGLTRSVSVDTRHDETVLQACEMFGVGWANNVKGLYSDATLKKLGRMEDTKYIAMHMKGDPKTMQQSPMQKAEALVDVEEKFALYRTELESAGFQEHRTYFDPGIGFGKDDSANLALLFATPHFARSYQVCIGVSRKSFFGRLLGINEPKNRDHVSKVAELGLLAAGASIIRTHDVATLSKLRVMYEH